MICNDIVIEGFLKWGYPPKRNFLVLKHVETYGFGGLYF